MSTMSLLRNIDIKNRRKATALVEALERAEREPPRRVEISRPVDEVRPKDAKNFLAKVKW